MTHPDPVVKVKHLKNMAISVLDFHAPPWNGLETHTLHHAMGEPPLYRPMTQFKIGYGGHAVFLIFKVMDAYVRAVAERYQDPVFKDSCVEFFFSPAPGVAEGYFNLEVNCCGVALFEFHPGKGKEAIRIPETVFREIGIACHLHGKIDPEIASPLTWSLAVMLPIDILSNFRPVVWPEPGLAWRANFHKCADLSSHPHWLTWAKIDFPTPRFHLPEFFGTLLFQ